MMNKFFKSIVFCLLIFSATGLFAQNENPYLNDNRVLMTVGKTPVTVSEFMFIYLKNNQGDVLDKKTIEEYVEMYANFKAKINEAEAQQLDTITAFHNELIGYRKDLAKPYFVDEEVVNKLIGEAYQRMQEDIRAGHILIFCNENAAPKDTLAAYKKIEAIRKRILKGEDFGTVAMETSNDPSAKDQPAQDRQPAIKGNKGDLGYFTVLNMIYPFETAAYNTPVNTVSPIFRTSFGYHILKTTDRQPALGNVQVAHIFFQSKPEYTQQQNDSLLHLANSVYEKLQNGGQWETLVRQYSNDKATITYDGVLPWFTCNRMDADFITTVRKLKNKGDIAPPVKTSYGYHIVRLEGTKPIAPFDDIKGDLRAKVLRDSRSELSIESIIAKIKKEYNYTVYTENLKKFQSLCSPSLLSGEWNPESVSKLALPLFKLGDTIPTTNDFIAYLESKLAKDKPNESPTASTETVETLTAKYFTTWSDATCHAYEDCRLEKKYPAFRITLNEYSNGILLYEMIEKEIWGRATTDTIGLKTFFEQNRSKYIWGDRRDFTVLHAEGFASGKDAEKAKASILKMLDKGKSDDEIKAAFSKSKSPIEVKIMHGKAEKGVNKEIDDFWNTPTPHAISKTQENSVDILRINKAIASEPKQLNETRGLAIIDYQEYLEKTWMQMLHKKYPVKVNQEVLNSIK